MKPGHARLLGTAWLVLLGAALLASAAGALSRARHIGERAWGCDPAGYLIMAKEVRRAAAEGRLPDYAIDEPQTRALVGFLESQDLPVEVWSAMTGPHAHHYHRSGRVAPQYPPGTGLMLAVFPQGEAVHGLSAAVIAVFLVVGFLALAAAAATRAWAAAAAVWAVPAAYFLTHAIVIPYYMGSAVFAAAAVLGLGGLALHVRRQAAEGAGGKNRLVRGLGLALALVPGVFALDAGWRAWPGAELWGKVVAGRIEYPAELTDPRAWVFADFQTGSLWYYEGKPAFKVLFSDPRVRSRVYRFVYARGEPVYVLRDSPSMDLIIQEIQQAGGVLEPRGYIDDCLYYFVRWPPGGP